MVYPAPTELPPLPQPFPSPTLKKASASEQSDEAFKRAHAPETIERCHRWPVRIVATDKGELHIRCALCTQSCMSLSRNGIPYQIEAHQMLACVTSHVLQAHRGEVTQGWTQ